LTILDEESSWRKFNAFPRADKIKTVVVVEEEEAHCCWETHNLLLYPWDDDDRVPYRSMVFGDDADKTNRMMDA
jgi:hypothetical protein